MTKQKKKTKLSEAEQELITASNIATSVVPFARGLDKATAAVKKFGKAVTKFGSSLNPGTGNPNMYGRRNKVNKNLVFNGCKALQVGPGRHARRTQNLILPN